MFEKYGKKRSDPDLWQKRTGVRFWHAKSAFKRTLKSDLTKKVLLLNCPNECFLKLMIKVEYDWKSAETCFAENNQLNEIFLYSNEFWVCNDPESQ